MLPLKDSCDDLKFIEAHFKLDEELCNKFSKLSNHSPEEFSSVYIARKYNGNYIYQFKNEKKSSSPFHLKKLMLLLKHFSIKFLVILSLNVFLKYKIF